MITDDIVDLSRLQRQTLARIHVLLRGQQLGEAFTYLAGPDVELIEPRVPRPIIPHGMPEPWRKRT